jgi:hypothetical protein
MPLPEGLQKYMKEIGADKALKDGTAAQTKEAAPSGERSTLGEIFSTPNVTPGHTPTYDELGWQQKLGQGVAHGLATTAVDIGRLASHVVPESWSNAVSNLPGAQRMTQFADAPYEGGLEQAGSYLTQGATMLAGPGELRAGQKALELSERVAPKFMGKPLTKAAEEAGESAIYRGPRHGVRTPEGEPTGWGYPPEAGHFNPATGTWVPPAKGTLPGKWVNPATWVKGAGDLAELSARGAAGGALGSPDDPATGAAIGAVTGPLGKGVSKAFQSKGGHRFAGYMAPELAYWGLHTATGLPYYPLVGPAVVWHASPIGKQLRRFGPHFLDKTGQIIGTINERAPQLGGYAAGSAYGNTFGPNAPPSYPEPTEDPDATVPVR